MTTFKTRIKTALSDNLSLSSKLFLRGIFSTSTKSLTAIAATPVIVARRVAGRLGVELPAVFASKPYFFEPPTLPAIDLIGAAKILAAGRTAPTHDGISVQTSIIIPVFNKAEFTLQCIRSLLQEIDLNEHEVIVVDNASTDQTEQVLAHFVNIVRLIRNEENRGFVDACNQGAAAAHGKYLLFLNNDTEVLPGWLNHLVETIEANPENGAVGSMFLYPDGSIQEAGAIVWKNGEAHHYGWGASPDDRRFNFAREVDYCSAASLLITKEIFQRLGGFDRRFAPAYYEDIDLCFGVRSLGFKVIYQPMSRVVHYEGATAGRDTAKGIKHFQILNREKFVDKWRDILEREHLEKNLKRLQEAAHRRQLSSVVVFDERVPSPDRDAGSARMFWILKSLRQWCHVVFVPFYGAKGTEYEQALWKEGIETADPVDYRRLLRSKGIRAAIVSRPSVAEAMIHRIRRIRSDLVVVLDMVDAHFIRIEREHQIAGDPVKSKEAENYRKLETRLALASDLIWCNSFDDKQVMEQAAPGKRIEVIPTIHEIHDSGKPFAERRDLLFVGNLAHRPNSDAVHYFMREIYPLIEARLPGVKLHIVGDNVADLKLAASASVCVTGYVPDIDNYWRSCRVFVAPIRFGAGVKGKIGDAMSYGLPVVTTSIGAESFGFTPDSDVMIADEPAAFAESVVRLYSQKELWEKLAANGRRHIEKYFTPEVIAETINNSIREVSSS
ncbi:MAG: glycosyltransferase [Pyrinomonadaceae bacterium]